MRSRRLPAGTLALLLAVSLLTACSKEAPKPMLDPLVEVYQVQRPSLPGPSGGASSAVPQASASTVLAQSNGLVESVLVKPGDRVVPGQALVRLDPIDARLADSSARVQIAAAGAQLASAEADFARYERLRQQNFISQAEFERRQAAVLAARAEHEARLDSLGLITSRALTVGLVQRLAVAKGQRIQAGAVLLVMSGASGQASQPVPASSQTERALRVPLAALINGGQAVMLVESIDGGHRVRPQTVTVVASDERWAQVSQGLAVGDQVVAIGAHLLTSGQRVRLPGGPPSSPPSVR